MSGFLIGGILVDSRGSRRFFRVFYARRFLRIIPLYWLLFAIWLLTLAGLVPGLTPREHSQVPWFAFLTFTQNFWMAQGRLAIVAFMSVTWSLAVEEQFYLAIPLFVRFVRERYLVL